MHIFRKSEPKITEKLNVLRKARKPFFTAYNVSCSHKVIVNRVSEMVRRYSVRFKKNEILVVFRNFHIAFYKIGEFYLLFGISVSKYAKYKRHTGFQICLNLFDSKVSSRKHFRFSLCGNRFPIGVLYLFF